MILHTWNMKNSIHLIKAGHLNLDTLGMDSDELFLPVEYTSIEEIIRNKRSTNPPGDLYEHEQETENHASRLSTVSTLYSVLQARDRNKEESPVQVNEDHGNATILNKNHGTAGSGLEIEKQTRYGHLYNVQDTWNYIRCIHLQAALLSL